MEVDHTSTSRSAATVPLLDGSGHLAMLSGDDITSAFVQMAPHNHSVCASHSPSWPVHTATPRSPQQRVQPRFSAEPPLLDFAAASSVFESPALMPANVALTLPTIDQLPAQMSGQTEFPLNPFSRVFTREAAASTVHANEPAEGGILMLHDLQESQASRAALVSAWRDYGPQFVPDAAGGGPNSSTYVASQTRGSSSSAADRSAGERPATLSKSGHYGAVPLPDLVKVDGGCDNDRNSARNRLVAISCSPVNDAGTASGYRCDHGVEIKELVFKETSHDARGRAPRLTEQGDVQELLDSAVSLLAGGRDFASREERGGGSVAARSGSMLSCWPTSEDFDCVRENNLTTGYCADEVRGAPLAESVLGKSMRGGGRSSGALRVAMAPGVKTGSGSGVIDGSVAILGSARESICSAAGDACMDSKAWATNGIDDVGHGRAGNGGSDGWHDSGDGISSGKCSARGESDGYGAGYGYARGVHGECNGDDEVRTMVRNEMSSASMTQHTVALQAGVSQPVLCTYLGGKSNVKSSGKNSRDAVRTKMIAWLGQRGRGLSAGWGAPCSEPVKSSGAVALKVASTHGAGSVAPVTTIVLANNTGKRSALGCPQCCGSSRGAICTCGKAMRKAATEESSSSGGGPGPMNGSRCVDGAKGAKVHAGNALQGKNVKLTPQHLHVAYIWYLKQRDAEGVGLRPGEEEAFCLNCKDGGDVLLCDYGGCTKSYHLRCCGLKSVPEGIWECPRHRCAVCGCGPSRTDSCGRPRQPDSGAASTLWPCRTCPMTFCERCLPEEIAFVGEEIVCTACYEVLQSDVAVLQLDLVKWGVCRGI